MKRLMAGAVLLGIAAALVACSTADNNSSTAPQASVAGSTDPGAAAPSATEASTTSSSEAPASAPASAPAAGGTATDFCGAFKELEAIDTNGADAASVGAQFQAAAADMRKYAPAEIQQAANTYANLMEAIGKAAVDHVVDEAEMSKAVSDAMAGNAKDVGTTAAWVANNCNL